MWRTGFQAMRLGVVVFLMPFMILLNPVLILMGSPAEIILAFGTCVVAAYFLAAGIEGYMLAEASWWQRLLFTAGGIALFIPGWQSDLVGLPLVLVATLGQIVVRRRDHRREVLVVLQNGKKESV